MMILIVSAVTFALLSAAGGDALSSLRENPQVSDETIEKLRRLYGLDRPFAVRYAGWLAGAIQGDLGESIYFRIPVAGLIWKRFLNTGLLAVAAMAIAAIVSLALSVFSVRFRNRFLDGFIEIVILLSASTPRIVLSLIALVLTLKLSRLSPNDSVVSFLLGSFVLAVPLIALFLAQLFEGLHEAMNEDFVSLARAKGLGEWTVIVKHALRAALNPFLTIFGFSLGALLGGSVIVETVLGWPGVGALMVTAVRGRDVPLVMGIVLIASVAVWLGNSLAEVLQVLNDPRLGTAE